MPEDGRDDEETEAWTRDSNEYVYQPRRHRLPFSKVPACIYFYYIGAPNTQSYRPIRHYYFHFRDDSLIPYDDVPGIIRILADNAQKNENNPAPIGYDLKEIQWWRKSYLCFVIDDDHLELARDNAIEFTSPNGEERNHSFFDGRDFEVYINGNYRRAFYCINHIKRNQAGGGLGHLGPTTQQFYFEINTNPPLGTARRIFPNSGGTNMGPPAAPPY